MSPAAKKIAVRGRGIPCIHRVINILSNQDIVYNIYLFFLFQIDFKIYFLSLNLSFCKKKNFFFDVFLAFIFCILFLLLSF